jgi:hypothetical protein
LVRQSETMLKRCLFSLRSTRVKKELTGDQHSEPLVSTFDLLRTKGVEDPVIKGAGAARAPIRWIRLLYKAHLTGMLLTTTLIASAPNSKRQTMPLSLTSLLMGHLEQYGIPHEYVHVFTRWFFTSDIIALSIRLALVSLIVTQLKSWIHTARVYVHNCELGFNLTRIIR